MRLVKRPESKSSFRCAKSELSHPQVRVNPKATRRVYPAWECILPALQNCLKKQSSPDGSSQRERERASLASAKQRERERERERAHARPKKGHKPKNSHKVGVQPSPSTKLVGGAAHTSGERGLPFLLAPEQSKETKRDSGSFGKSLDSRSVGCWRSCRLGFGARSCFQQACEITG